MRLDDICLSRRQDGRGLDQIWTEGALTQHHFRGVQLEILDDPKRTKLSYYETFANCDPFHLLATSINVSPMILRFSSGSVTKQSRSM